jgi:uncharacterized protein YjbI with pentapeptide repeats
MSEYRRFSNKISSIDMNSYRAYKNIIKSSNNISPLKNTNRQDNESQSHFYKINNYNIEKKNLSTTNLTKSMFSSQSKRFEWQTDQAKNKIYELGSIKDLRQKELNTNKWRGFINLSQCENSNKKYEKYKK